MQRTFKVDVSLDLSEVRQDCLPPPAGGAASLPFVIIRRKTTVGELAIYRRTPAHDTSLLITHLACAGRVWVVARYVLGGHAQLVPKEARITRGQAGTAVQDDLGHAPIQRVPPGFAQQNAVASARRQPVGEDTSCRS